MSPCGACELWLHFQHVESKVGSCFVEAWLTPLMWMFEDFWCECVWGCWIYKLQGAEKIKTYFVNLRGTFKINHSGFSIRKGKIVEAEEVIWY